jgi:hypothetical protein
MLCVETQFRGKELSYEVSHGQQRCCDLTLSLAHLHLILFTGLTQKARVHLWAICSIPHRVTYDVKRLVEQYDVGESR